MRNTIPAKTAINPVFMFGYERSGTTLLSMMAGAHTELAVPLSVTGMWYIYAERLEEYGSLDEDANLEILVADILAEERIRLWDELLDLGDIMRHLDNRSFPAIIAAFYRAYAEKKHKPNWGILDIATLDAMDLAYQWFPNGRFVHIVRDGRDVALSHETMPYGAANTLDCAQSWERRLTMSFKMGAMLPNEQYLVIRYEDLILDTEAALRRLCRFIGLEYSPAMLQYSQMVDSKIPKDRRWLWPALSKEPQKSKCYAWKRRMPYRKRLVFEGEARGVLKQLGYETLDEMPKAVSAYAHELWCFLGRQGRLRRLRKVFWGQGKSQLEKEWDSKNAG